MFAERGKYENERIRAERNGCDFIQFWSYLGFGWMVVWLLAGLDMAFFCVLRTPQFIAIPHHARLPFIILL